MRFFLFGLIFGSWLFAYDFEICKKYYQVASKKIENSRVVLIEHGDKKFYIGFFSKAPKDVEILKADPFVGLYAFPLTSKDAQTYMIMPLDDKALSLNMADLAEKYAEKGIVIEPQKGFLTYARFSAQTIPNSVISNICYQIYGIGMGDNLFIDSQYLLRFIEQEEPYYGDIGVRLYMPNKNHPHDVLKVEYVDPFFPNVPFLKDDEILSINNKEFKDYYDFEWYVANLEEHSTANVRIRRADKIETFSIKVSRRYGGFLLPDRFFERIGITLNDELMITAIDPKFQALQQGLLVGDRILWINNKKILNPNEKTQSKEVEKRLRFLLTEAVKLGRLDILISREGFQFSLNLIGGLNNAYIQSRYNPFGF
ncbi:DUF7488 domain-containing protein [Helicobacter cholecystus]|uniref:DUF7488 domain-containing protein n=1 Tax=Helicobacter cholecystus TaxID=45498 RepID=UPI002738960E|nr:PDZ domain-containing protein [Helicobacter cholecystus]